MNLKIARIVSSPLVCAHKTAEVINEHLRVPMHIIHGLKERSVGVLEGTVIDKSMNGTDRFNEINPKWNPIDECTCWQAIPNFNDIDLMSTFWNKATILAVLKQLIP